MVEKKKTWITPFIEAYNNTPHRILPPFDMPQYLRPLSKARKLLGEKEAVRRYHLFCSWSGYLHAANFVKHLEDWK